mgnify:CR=1
MRGEGVGGEDQRGRHRRCYPVVAIEDGLLSSRLMHLLRAWPRSAPACDGSSISVGRDAWSRGSLGDSSDRLVRLISRLSFVVTLSVAEEEI